MSEIILRAEVYTTHGRVVLDAASMTDEQMAAARVLLGAEPEPCQLPRLVPAPLEGFDWPPNASGGDFECCASGSCEVCRR